MPTSWLNHYECDHCNYYWTHTTDANKSDNCPWCGEDTDPHVSNPVGMIV